MTVTAPSALVSVLIVDDTDTVRLLLRHCLTVSGRFEVVGEAVDGTEGIGEAARLQPDIILLDLAMPGVDGLAAIPRLARCSPGSLIIVLSGFDADAAGAEAISVGAHAYIEKKHRPDEMLRRVCAAWDSARGHDAVPTGVGRPPTAGFEESSPGTAARAVHDQFVLAFDRAPIGTALVTADGRLVEVNNAFCSITGHRESNLVGRHIDDISHAEDRDVDARPTARLLAGEISSYQSERRIVRADATPVWVLLSRSLFAAGGGEPQLSVTQIIDITAHRSLARELEAANVELARSNADLSDFAAVAAHDLRSPLQVILGFGELLTAQHGPRLDDQGRELLASVVIGARRMEGLIEDLMAYCRVGSAEWVATDTDLNEVLSVVRAVLGPEIGAVRAMVTNDRLPRVHGDPVQLRGLLLNLIANALKFTCDGVTPRVHIGARWVEDGWVVSVTDNGIGIDGAQRERIFGMFTRLHPQNLYGGTGIGLAICQRIVARHGGRIWAEENPDGGSRFVFRLPGRSNATGSPDTGSPDTGSPDTGPAPADAAMDRPLKILLVEDSPEHAKLIAALLMAAQPPGYHLATAATVGDAVASMWAADVDCVLLDLSLPDADDLEALAQVRAAAPLLAIVVITSSADETLAFTAVREGAQDYLVKGRIDAEQLSQSIRWAVQSKALETDLARGALHDALTNLPNRTLLLDRLRSALARVDRSGQLVALLYLDLDDFKPINDRFGHEIGDQVLAAVADRLRGSMRPQDTACRLGGDEFVVLCEGFDDAECGVRAIRARLEHVIAAPITVAGHTVQVRASIGSTTNGPGDSPDAMLRRADAAMYQAKQGRRSSAR